MIISLFEIPIKGSKHLLHNNIRPINRQKGACPMRMLEKARRLLQNAGLAFPSIPKELAAGFKEHSKWFFFTRGLKMSQHNLQPWCHEAEFDPEEYAIPSPSCQGVNSYAIQYFLVSGRLRMFLHSDWGGMYMHANEASSKIRESFSLADQTVSETSGRLLVVKRLMIAGSDFYDSYWFALCKSR